MTTSVSVNKSGAPACLGAAIGAAEQKILQQLRAFREANRSPDWSGQLAEAWDGFLTKLERRIKVTHPDRKPDDKTENVS